MEKTPLSAKRALITGASAGIGEAFAREFASHGYNLVLAARREERLRELAAELEQLHGIDVRPVACDLVDSGAALGLFQSCADLEVDVLLNNAGIMYRGDFKDQSPSNIDNIIQLNIASLTQLTRLFLPPMVERDEGREGRDRRLGHVVHDLIAPKQLVALRVTEDQVDLEVGRPLVVGRERARLEIDPNSLSGTIGLLFGRAIALARGAHTVEAKSM